MTTLMQDLAPLSRAIGLRAERQQVLASNIANADTPGYKARDFDFRTAFQNAMGGQAVNGGLAMARTSGRHLEGGAGSASVNLQYRVPLQASADGNTVDMDSERSQMSENALQYEILTNLISDQIKGMRSALASTQS